jgi:chemotaxis protein histidine kinase CheA
MSPANPDAFQQMLLQLRNTFLEEMPEKLDLLDQLLVAMEKNGVNSDSFNEAVAAHSASTLSPPFATNWKIC